MRRLHGRHAAVLGPAALVAVWATILEAASPRAFVDLSVYRFGAEQVLHGDALYAGADPATGLLFTYPPFAALLFVPLAALPSPVAAGLVAGGSVAALGWTVRSLAPRLAPTALALLLAGLLVLEPVWRTLTFGQVNLLLMAVVAAAVLQPDRARSPWLLGVAAGVKLTPLVFVVFLALAGHGRAAAKSLLAFVGTVLVGVVLLTDEANAFWGSAVWESERVGNVAYVSNQSVNGLLARLGDGHAPTALWLVVAGAASVAALACGVAWYRRGDRVLGLGLGGTAMLLASPISWSHHWVWVVVVVLALPRTAPLVAAVFATRMIWWPSRRGEGELGWGAVQQVAGNSYLLLAGLLVVGSAVALLRTRPGRSELVGLGPTTPTGAGHGVEEPQLQGRATAEVGGGSTGSASARRTSSTR